MLEGVSGGVRWNNHIHTGSRRGVQWGHWNVDM